MPESEAHAKRLQALAESTQMFAEASTDLTRLLELVGRRFADLVGDAANIRLIDGDMLVPVSTVATDPEVERYLRAYHDDTPLRVGEGISGQVLATGEPYFEPALDLALLRTRIAPQFLPTFEKIGITGMIVARLRARGVNLGYLSLFRTQADRLPYTRADVLLVQDLADRAALAIDNSLLLDGLERRVAERTHALATANQELEAFAFSVSHDLRSPLRSLDAFSQILEEDHADALGDDGKKVVATIRRNAQRMSRLVDALLRLSRVGHQALQPVSEVDMRELVDSTLANIRATHPDLALDVRVGDIPRAIGNTDLLRQVWINLLDNAVKYSGKRAIVRIEVDGARDGGELRYTVTDHGAGFDPAYSDKLFGVFSRLHGESEFEGTGVGLALVHRVVTRHGGRVWAEGRIDAGATFGFALPERGPAKR